MEPYGFGDTTPFDYGKQESNTDGATICFPQIEYNIYGILNFLQTEWSKMSIERSRWEYDRAELEVIRLSRLKFAGQNCSITK